jgi:hypothetical protein
MNGSRNRNACRNGSRNRIANGNGSRNRNANGNGRGNRIASMGNGKVKGKPLSKTIFEEADSPQRVLTGSQRTRGLERRAAHLFDSLRLHFLLPRLLPPFLLPRLFGRFHELRHRVRDGQILLQLVLQGKERNAE